MIHKTIEIKQNNYSKRQPNQLSVVKLSNHGFLKLITGVKKMNKLYSKTIAILLTVFILSTTAQAGFDITRMTTIVDDYKGSYTVTKVGRREEMEFSGTDVAEFSSFHPFNDNADANISGTLSRTITKVEGTRTTISDAQLVFIRPDNTLNITFNDLTVTFTKEEISIDGEITVNDETFPADDLPPKLAKLLKRIFKLTRK